MKFPLFTLFIMLSVGTENELLKRAKQSNEKRSKNEMKTKKKKKNWVCRYLLKRLNWRWFSHSTLNENETELKWNRCVFKFVKCRAIHHSFFRWNECQVQIQHIPQLILSCTHTHTHKLTSIVCLPSTIGDSVVPHSTQLYNNSLGFYYDRSIVCAYDENWPISEWRARSCT